MGTSSEELTGIMGILLLGPGIYNDDDVGERRVDQKVRVIDAEARAPSDKSSKVEPATRDLTTSTQ